MAESIVVILCILIRAVLEGVAFNLKIILDVFAELGAQLTEVRLIGGVAKG